MKRRIQTILVGLGRIGSLLEQDSLRKKPCTHAGTLQSHWGKKRFQLRLGVDRDLSKTQSFGSYWKVPTESQIPENLSSYDLGVIATPSESHVSLALELLNKGVKGVLIEKPMALSTREACLLKGKTDYLWVNHERRYHPNYAFAKDQLDKGNWGKPMRVVASVCTNVRQPGRAFTNKGGGIIFHDGTHALDLLFWFFPKLKLIHFKNKQKKGENPIRSISYWEQGDTEIILEISGSRSFFLFEIDILTDTHRVLLSNDGCRFWESSKSSLYQGFTSLVERPWPNQKSFLGNAFIGIYEEIYLSLMNKDKSPKRGGYQENYKILKALESLR